MYPSNKTLNILDVKFSGFTVSITVAHVHIRLHVARGVPKALHIYTISEMQCRIIYLLLRCSAMSMYVNSWFNQRPLLGLAAPAAGYTLPITLYQSFQTQSSGTDDVRIANPQTRMDICKPKQFLITVCTST